MRLTALCNNAQAIALRQLHSKDCSARACAICVLESRIHAALAPGAPSVQTPTSGAAPFAVAPGHVAGDGDNRQRTQ